MIVLMLVIFIVYLIYILIDWSINTPGDTTKIKFKAFEKFYAINPERWELKDSYVVCLIEDQNRRYSYYRSYDRKCFCFGVLDYRRYKRFCKMVERNKIKEKDMKNIAEMLGAVRQDITNMENLADQQKKQAMDNLNSILNNLGGTK